MKLFTQIYAGMLVVSLLVALALPLLAQELSSVGEPIIAVQNMLWIDTNIVVEDAEAILVRMDHGLSMTIETTELEPEYVYTVWWVIFNKPENCSNRVCGLDDAFLMDNHGQYIRSDDGLIQPNPVGRELTLLSSLRATGNIGYEDGSSVFMAHLPIGDMTDDIAFGPALLDPMASEVHLIIRTHGPIIPELLNEQLMTAWGGCPDPYDRLPCEDVQFARFLAYNSRQ